MEIVKYRFSYFTNYGKICKAKLQDQRKITQPHEIQQQNIDKETETLGLL